MENTIKKLLISTFAVLALLGSTIGVIPAYAAAIVVDNDTDDTLVNLAGNGFCDLREAIEAANTDAAVDACASGAVGLDTITFNASLSGGTIYLASTLTLSQNVTIDGSALATKITISGDTNNDTTGDVQVLGVNTGITATLDSLIITKGSSGSGGGIFNGGTVTITNSTLSGNSATSTGGAIYNDGTVTITNSTLSGNFASASGGGIYSNSGTLTVTSSTLSGNTAALGSGGGIYNFGSTLTVANSTFSGNSASGSGGGIYNYPGNTLNITNSTFANNGALYGGGIINYGALMITNSTLSGNTATNIGGGIYNDISLLNYANTIIANSVSGGDCFSLSSIGTNTNNLVEDGSCSASFSGDPNLDALGDNGGPTQTIALLGGSTAIDGGDDTTCTNAPVGNLDQRGVARPIGTHCDIGAIEQDTVAPVVNSFTATSPSTSLNIPITAFTALDSVAVTGYKITESATAPGINDSGWTASAPTIYTVPSVGNYTLYPWAKDAVGHVSALYSSPASVDVCLGTATVTSNADSGAGTLRQAIADACAGGTILFDNSLSGDTIHLASTLAISKDLTIDGSTLTPPITISGDSDNNGTGDVRVFYVPLNLAPPFTFTVTLDSLIVTKGLASGANEDGEGGAVRNHGTLTIKNSTFSNNSSTGSGGAIVAYGAVTIIDSTFSGNSSSDTIGGGGAIYNAHGLTIKNSLFSGNSASASGGGGGAIINTATATIANSTFTGNTATVGGAILALNNLSITNSTISGNSAMSTGGLDVEGNVTHLRNTIIANNFSSTIGSTSNNDCVDNSDYPDPPSPDGDGIMTNINNLIEDGSCSPTLSGDPKLGPLADNGGPTQTMSLLPGSFAIDAGDDSVCVAAPVNNLDQRGMARAYGSHCDIGAYELEFTFADVQVDIGGNNMGNYNVLFGERIVDDFDINSGPMHVESTNGLPIFTSQRAIYGSSFSSIVGYPADQLTTDYWFTSYDDLGMLTYLVIGNPDPTLTAEVDVYIGGVKKNITPYQIGPGQRIFPRYGINGGPVHVVSTNGVDIFTSERSKFGNSFNEVMGYPGDQLTTDYWFTSYDDLGMITYLVIGNPHATLTAEVDVYIGGIKRNATPYSIAPGQRVFPRYAINGGPVHVVSTNGVDIFTSERSKFGQSFNEVLGYPADQLSTDYWFTSYDDASMITYLVIGNPHPSNTALVDVYIAGVKKNVTPYSIAPGQRVFPRYAIDQGPVEVISTNGVNIFTSERSKYLSSFNEILGLSNDQLATDYWFTSYDDVGMTTYLVIAAP